MLRSNFVSPHIVSSRQSQFAGSSYFLAKQCQQRSHSTKRAVRGPVEMVIPFQRGDALQQPPPDLASYLFKNRIIYLGMSLVPAVTELLVAELLYLQYDDPKKPIYMYINSTGTTKDGEKLGYETEAFGIYDTMMYIKNPIYTLAVGSAWGEAAFLLAAGVKGNRAALPSATIMIKQPVAQMQGQATDIDNQRKEVRRTKTQLIEILAKHTDKTPEEIELAIARPKYMSPQQAVEFNIIDKVIDPKNTAKGEGVVESLRRSRLPT